MKRPQCIRGQNARADTNLKKKKKKLCFVVEVVVGKGAKKKKEPVTTGYLYNNVTDLIIIQFIIISCGFKVCRGFKYQPKVT